MSKTSIEWTQETWNPTVGCDRISPGCANCYAKTLHDKRHKAVLDGAKLPAQYLKPFETLQLMDDRLDAPLRKRKPTTYFVNSVSDLFHKDVPDEFIDRVFAVMSLAGRHTFQVLTKRADRLLDYMTRPRSMCSREATISGAIWSQLGTRRGSKIKHGGNWRCAWPLPNVWLGVSVENQHFADERIPLLLQTPAAVRFISAEPLLGPVDLSAIEVGRETQRGGHTAPLTMNALADYRGNNSLDWVIVGGESGAGARPLDLAWARSIVQQCQAAGVPVFVKQLGARAETDSMADLNGHLARGPRWLVLKGKGGDPSEWPEDLRVRQFPEARS